MYNDIYDRIDELLKERGMSRRKLAQKAGININTMSTLFARRPERFPEEHLQSIAQVLNVPVSSIKGANLRLFKPSEVVFDADKINHAIFRTHAEQPPEADSTAEPAQPMSFSRFCAALEAMDDEELELISLYLEHLRKKRGQ